MSSVQHTRFIETSEYHRFAEFCDACRRNRYIGLCYGPPGVGKTLSARHYANWDKVGTCHPVFSSGSVPLKNVLGSDSVFYTVPVINSPKRLQQDIHNWRRTLHSFAIEQLHRQRGKRHHRIREREIREHEKLHAQYIYRGPLHKQIDEESSKAFRRLNEDHRRKEQATQDPTTLITIDEADRLKMASLEQVRAIFDCGDIGMVLIGMPGLEKRLARYPQLYSRIGFVHAFRPLSAAGTRQFLQDRWRPSGVALPEHALDDEEGLATIIRVTGGNFRLLHRLMTQIGRVLEINSLDSVTGEVVDAARESLVIGTA